MSLIEFSSREESTSALVDQYAEQSPVCVASLDSATINAFKKSSCALDAECSVYRSVFRSLVISTLLTDEHYASRMTEDDMTMLTDVVSQRARTAEQGVIFAPEAQYLEENANETGTNASYSYLYRTQEGMVEKVRGRLPLLEVR